MPVPVPAQARLVVAMAQVAMVVMAWMAAWMASHQKYLEAPRHAKSEVMPRPWPFFVWGRRDRGVRIGLRADSSCKMMSRVVPGDLVEGPRESMLAGKPRKMLH